MPRSPIRLVKCNAATRLLSDGRQWFGLSTRESPGWRLLWLVFLLMFRTTNYKARAAQTPAELAQEHFTDTWESEDGLPEDSATAMVQADDGYLWFGTFNGLVRFDGVSFEVFNPANTPGLPSAGIVNLHLDRRGWLWISTYEGLVVRQKSGWRNFRKPQGWAGDFARSFAERQNGDLLITTFDGHVLEFKADQLKELPPPPGAAKQGYLAYADEAGRWWVLQNEFIGSWDGEQWQRMVPTAELVPDVVGGGRARDGGLWLLRSRTLAKYHHGKEVSRIELPELPGGFWSLFEDSRTNVWICTYDKGMLQITPDGHTHRWNTTNGLHADGVRFVFEDNEGNRWVGTSGGGLVRIKDRRIRMWGTEQGLPLGLNSVCADHAGELWVGTYGNGLYRQDNFGFVPAELPAGSRFPTYFQSVLHDRANRIWLGAYKDGLFQVENNAPRHFSPADTGGNNIIAMFEDSRGRIWVSGGGDGIGVFNGKEFRHLGIDQGVGKHAVVCFAEDRDHRIWFTDKTGVFRLNNEHFAEVLDQEKKSLGEVSCLVASDDGSVWMGSNGRGLLRWRAGSLARVDERAGLPDTTIYSMLDDQQGCFWVSSRLGILRISRNDLNAVADGREPTLNFQILDRSDGLITRSFPVDRQPSAARDTNGRLWFATGKGLAMIDPKGFRLNGVPPTVHIERVIYQSPVNRQPAAQAQESTSSEGQQFTLTGPFLEPLQLPPGSHRMEIQYSATCYSAPEKVRFQIKLDGLDNEWHNRAAGSERVASFYELGPGSYTFRVRAANNDGIWNEAGTLLAFVVQPFFWQTWWFRAGILILFINAGGIAVWWRTRTAHNRELLELERVRRQEVELAHASRLSIMGELSASMAHELNQPLTAILTNAQAGQRFLAASDPDLVEFSEILKDIAHDTTRARDVIRHLRALVKKGEREFKPLEVNETIGEVVGFLHGDIVARNVQVSLQPASDLPAIEGDRIQLQQVVINLLLNAFDAMSGQPVAERRVIVSTEFEPPSRVHVVIRDEGPGIPSDKLDTIFDPFFTTKHEGMGMGLSVTRSIVESHGGRIWAENLSPRGAALHFTLHVTKPS